MKRTKYYFKDFSIVFIFAVIGFLLASVILSQIISLIANGEGINFIDVSSRPWAIYLNAFLTEFAYFLIFIIYSKLHKIDIKNATSLTIPKLNKRTNIALPFMVALLLLVTFFCSLNFINMTTHFLSQVLVAPVSSVPLANFGQFLLSVLFFAVVPAVVEELLFRGLIFNGLKNSFNAKVAVILTSIIFTLIHFSIFQTVYQLILGVVLSLILLFTNSLLLTMLMHFLNNFLIVFISYLSQGKSIFEFANFGVLEIVLSIVIFLVGVAIVCLIFYFIKRLVKYGKNSKIKEDEINGKANLKKDKTSVEINFEKDGSKEITNSKLNKQGKSSVSDNKIKVAPNDELDTPNSVTRESIALSCIGVFIALVLWCINSFGG